MKLKVIIALIVSFFAFQAYAVEKQIYGESATEVYEELVAQLKLTETSMGDAPEAACYNQSNINLGNMVCYAAHCWSDETDEQEWMHRCDLTDVDNQELDMLSKILKIIGVSASNQIFKD